MYFCFLGGILLRLHLQKFKSNIKVVTCLSGATLVILLILTKGGLPLKGINVIDIIKLPQLLDYINKIAVSLSSSLFFIGLALWISKNKKCAEFFAKSKLTMTGKYTLGIYILQSIILETIMAEYIKGNYWGRIFSSLTFDLNIFFPLVSFVVMMTCAYLTIFINRNYVLNFWLLGTLKKKK